MQPAQTWRLLRHPPAQGAWNMAVDEAILEAATAGISSPTLRLYAWEPACLSLGLAQPARDADLAALTRHGWNLVRRPTGGRAILHTDELTYAVIAPVHEPLVSGGVLESYNRIAQALLRALEQLALPARADHRYDLPAGSERKGPVCFEVPSNYEITVEGKKLIGSAQARRKEGVLQHGTLPLMGDLARITEALVYPDEMARNEGRRRLLEHALTVETALGRRVSWGEAAAAFASAFEDVCGLKLLPGELTPSEIRRAETLASEKYGHPSWTQRF
jgi:lipoyl(octanoyl) transferase